MLTVELAQGVDRLSTNFCRQSLIYLTFIHFSDNKKYSIITKLVLSISINKNKLPRSMSIINNLIMKYIIDHIDL
jgi:hypothetical protein